MKQNHNLVHVIHFQWYLACLVQPKQLVIPLNNNRNKYLLIALAMGCDHLCRRRLAYAQSGFYAVRDWFWRHAARNTVDGPRSYAKPDKSENHLTAERPNHLKVPE